MGLLLRDLSRAKCLRKGLRMLWASQLPVHEAGNLEFSQLPGHYPGTSPGKAASAGARAAGPGL